METLHNKEYVALVDKAKSHFQPLQVNDTKLETVSRIISSFNYERYGSDWKIDSEGNEQSPINISDRTVESSVTQYLKIWWNHLPVSAEVRDTGHTIIVEAPISRITGTDVVDRINRLYEPMQFHFHSPSEHTINDKRYPLEMHIVHMVEYEQFETELTEHREIKRFLGVVGILFDIDDAASPNAFIDSLQMDKINTNEKVVLDLSEFMEYQKPEYYGYSGSLTTPPCSEIVNWFILKKVFTMTSTQFEKFAKIEIFQGHGNSRTIQPLNGRRICCGNCKSFDSFAKGFGLSKQQSKPIRHQMKQHQPAVPESVSSQSSLSTPTSSVPGVVDVPPQSFASLKSSRWTPYDIINPSYQSKLPETVIRRSISRYEGPASKISIKNKESASSPFNPLFRKHATDILTNR